MPYGITPGRGDIAAFTPAEAGTRFSDPAKVIDMIPKDIFWRIVDCFGMYVTGVTRSDAFRVLFHADRRRIGGCGHFQSRDKDGGHTARFPMAENPMLYANFKTLSQSAR